MHAKKVALRIFFSVEVLVFSYVYLHGKNSITMLVDLQKENRVLQSQLHGQRQEIAQLEHEIAQWEAHPFYKEKVAREQLQMARKNEQVYYRAS